MALLVTCWDGRTNLEREDDKQVMMFVFADSEYKIE
jgi:hypothetical protein